MFFINQRFGALLFFLIVSAGCSSLFGPDMVNDRRSQPIRTEYRLHDHPPASVGLVDTSAVYVWQVDLAVGSPPRGTSYFRYLRFSASGNVFLSPFYPDSLNLQTALLQGEQGTYGVWTLGEKHGRSKDRTALKMEFYDQRLREFFFWSATAYSSSVIINKRKIRALFGASDSRHYVYRKRSSVSLEPIRWPE